MKTKNKPTFPLSYFPENTVWNLWAAAQLVAYVPDEDEDAQRDKAHKIAAMALKHANLGFLALRRDPTQGGYTPGPEWYAQRWAGIPGPWPEAIFFEVDAKEFLRWARNGGSTFPKPIEKAFPPDAPGKVFEPNPFEQRILDALKGKFMTAPRLGTMLGVSQDTLKKALERLKRAELIGNRRGPGGGYHSVKSPPQSAPVSTEKTKAKEKTRLRF